MFQNHAEMTGTPLFGFQDDLNLSCDGVYGIDNIIIISETESDRGFGQIEAFMFIDRQRRINVVGRASAASTLYCLLFSRNLPV